MKFRTTVSEPVPVYQRAALTWCARQIGVPLTFLRTVDIRKSSRRGGISGRYYRNRRAITMRVGRESVVNYTRFGIPVKTINAHEGFIYVLAHELAHAYDYWTSAKTNERSAVMQSARVLQTYRDNEMALIADWASREKIPAPVSTPPQRSKQEDRAERAVELLTEWERKAKYAANKVRVYKRKVRYYEKIAASKVPAE